MYFIFDEVRVATTERGENKEALVTGFVLKKSGALDAFEKTPGLYVRNDTDVAKVKKDIETIKENLKTVSQIVDKNGEPAVFYHGTGSFGFNEFKERREQSCLAP